MSQLPHLAITLGDPAGIGAEIILKALANPSLTENCRITVIGCRAWLQTTYKHLLAKNNGNNNLADPASFDIIDIPLDNPIVFGKGNAITGKASFTYLETAIDLTLAGKFQAIVTAPIAKYLWQAAGYDYPGQTEVLATKAGISKYGMLFVAKSSHTGWMLRCLLATTHIPLAKVSQTLTPELMSGKLELLIDCLRRDFDIQQPKIAISGLNPHSGEAGQLGTEEVEWLLTWLDDARKNYPQVQLLGLIPPDTMWVNPGQAWYGGINTPQTADGYLALYHDQGLIPVKLMAFDRAINTTIGLPFIRTSPDHGTAFDIAGLGIASASSMEASIELASTMANRGRYFN
jgi:4-hydroxythreonine-4-phosphate dehydrogenase